MPDDTLLNQVKSGALSSSESLRKTILDMAKNAKAIGLVRNFTRQWLGHQDLLLRNPTPPLDADIMKDFETEALSFVSEFLRSNRSVKELLGSDFTFINGRLAKLYDITGDGVDFKRTNPSMQRNLGVLSQGAFLVATSNPSSTSPVRRGHWILENLLCEPPPPSPPNVDFGTFQSAGDNLSAREKLQQHTTNPSCAACHAKIDSIGMAFENYDHFGVWRDSETAGKIITDGKLPEGFAFRSPTDLVQYFKNSPSFPRCVAKKLAIYALGRLPEGSEVCVVDSIGKRAESSDYGFRDMVVDIGVELLAR